MHSLVTFSALTWLCCVSTVHPGTEALQPQTPTPTSTSTRTRNNAFCQCKSEAFAFDLPLSPPLLHGTCAFFQDSAGPSSAHPTVPQHHRSEADRGQCQHPDHAPAVIPVLHTVTQLL